MSTEEQKKKFFSIAEPDVVSHRLDLCHNCEHNKVGICAKCGCIIQAKTRLKGSSCPIHIWEAVE